MKKIIYIFLLVPSFAFPQWVNINHYWDIPIFEGVDIVDSNTIYASGVEYVLKSSNGGANWFSVFQAPENFIRDVYFMNLNTGFFIKTMGNLPYPIYKTTNAGYNWFGVFSPFWSSPMRIDMVDSLYGYVACENDVYKTTNGGNNWYLCYHSVFFNQNGFGIYFINRDTGYYGNRSSEYQEQIFKTTNGGSNWIRNNLGGPSYITGISMCNAYTGYAVSTSTIYKTSDGSFEPFEVERWFGVGSGMWDIIAINPDTVYIASAQGIIKTTNGGENWFVFSTGNNGIMGIDMLNTTTGYAVGTNRPGSTNGVIYKTTNGGYVIGIEPINNEFPSGYNLSQNYPNPFNSLTIIHFEVPKEGNVKLIIYDITGREIQRLADSDLHAGKYYINWDAEKFTSGIYFFRLESGNFNESRKMILLK